METQRRLVHVLAGLDERQTLRGRQAHQVEMDLLLVLEGGLSNREELPLPEGR